MKPSVSVQVKEVLPLFNFLYLFFPSEAGSYARLFFYSHADSRESNNEATSASIAGTVPTAGRDDIAAHVS